MSIFGHGVDGAAVHCLIFGYRKEKGAVPRFMKFVPRKKDA